MSNAVEVSTRGSWTIFVGIHAKSTVDLKLPEAPDLTLPFVQAVAMQMISYYGVLAKGPMWIS